MCRSSNVFRTPLRELSACVVVFIMHCNYLRNSIGCLWGRGSCIKLVVWSWRPSSFNSRSIYLSCFSHTGLLKIYAHQIRKASSFLVFARALHPDLSRSRLLHSGTNSHSKLKQRTQSKTLEKDSRLFYSVVPSISGHSLLPRLRIVTTWHFGA